MVQGCGEAPSSRDPLLGMMVDIVDIVESESMAVICISALY